MDILALITVILLIIIGSFHLYWALGGKIGLDKALPTKDGIRLINPGRGITFFVGIVLFVFSSIAYTLNFNPVPANYTTYFGWMISALFFIRAIGEFNAVGFFKKIRSTEFSKYDTRYFSPLSLFLGVAFALLSAQVFN